MDLATHQTLPPDNTLVKIVSRKDAKLKKGAKKKSYFAPSAFIFAPLRETPYSHVAGEQMWQGLKPWALASAAVVKPTRFLREMVSTQWQFSRWKIPRTRFQIIGSKAALAAAVGGSPGCAFHDAGN